jgi:hypothetical protein
MQRRRTRIVLTPAAKAAGFTHGVAPGMTTKLTALTGRALPSAPEGQETPGAADREGTAGFRKGAEIPPHPNPVVRKLRDLGSALNDRAAHAYQHYGRRHSA